MESIGKLSKALSSPGILFSSSKFAWNVSISFALNCVFGVRMQHVNRSKIGSISVEEVCTVGMQRYHCAG